jgi:hypothetical protein
MGCASSKTAEDKDEMSGSKNRKNLKSSPQTAAAVTTNASNLNHSNGKQQSQQSNVANKTKANANNISGSLSTSQNAGANPAQATQMNKQTSINSTTATANTYVNGQQSNNLSNLNNNSNNNNNNPSATQIESNNLILLTEFFKAVGNGELEKLKQILSSLDELNAPKKSATTSATSKSAQIRMSRAELLNAGMADADGLTALSIAAGRKHKDLTEFLADLNDVDVNKASESGITPLLMVAEVGWTDVMKKLLKRGAHVDAAPRGKTAEEAKIAGSTPLIGATKYNNPEAV